MYFLSSNVPQTSVPTKPLGPVTRIIFLDSFTISTLISSRKTTHSSLVNGLLFLFVLASKDFLFARLRDAVNTVINQLRYSKQIGSFPSNLETFLRVFLG